MIKVNCFCFQLRDASELLLSLNGSSATEFPLRDVSELLLSLNGSSAIDEFPYVKKVDCFLWLNNNYGDK